MKTKTTSVTKAKTTVQAPVKAPIKAPVKAPTKATFWYGELLMRALKSEFGPLIARYYKSAIKNHTKPGHVTVFPRPRNAGEGLLKAAEAITWLEGHKLTSIPPGNKVGQRLFDEMMVQAKAMPKPAAKAA